MITVSSLYKLARDNGAKQCDLPQEDDFEILESATVVIEPEPYCEGGESPHPLMQFSINKSLGDMKASLDDEVFVIDGVALKGQLTTLYSSPNCGKTLLTIHGLIEAVKSGRIKAEYLFYINADDSYRGVIDKGEIFDSYGINTIALNHNGFDTSKLVESMEQTIERGLAKESIYVVDTLKKFNDVMSKTKASKYWKGLRGFSANGGTVISLAHTNKNEANGKPVYGGTSDSVDDVDCAYTLQRIDEGSKEKVVRVEFENIKNRGDVVMKMQYQYSIEEGLTYRELLESVERVESNDLLEGQDTKSSANLIRVIEECISDGITQKMALIQAVSEHSGVSKSKVRKLIEHHTGDDPSRHKWNYQLGDRGAHIFSLLPSVTPLIEESNEQEDAS